MHIIQKKKKNKTLICIPHTATVPHPKDKGFLHFGFVFLSHCSNVLNNAQLYDL